MKLRGIIHVHSTYSYDGRHTIAELASYARSKGYGFIGICDHSDTLDGEKTSSMADECRRCSGPDLTVIPGIEFSCKSGLHVIGLGVTGFTESKDPFEVAEFIRKDGGISIIAHPVRYDYVVPDGLISMVDGIEAWSASYDGRFVPNDRTLRLLKSAREKGLRPLAFGGMDLHRINGRQDLVVNLESRGTSAESILESLREGRFFTGNAYSRIASGGEPGALGTLRIYAMRRFYLAAKWARDRFGSFLADTGESGQARD